MPRLPESGFDRAAPFYDRLARLVYGNALEQSQQALLPFIPNHARVLVIGGGSGWLLEQLLLTGKKLDILYLDASPAMLRRAKQRYGQLIPSHTCTVTFRLGTEQALGPQDQFEVIITPFLLDLFPPERLKRLMATLAAALLPNGNWLFADFWPVQQPPPLWQRLLIRSMYTFFGAISGVEARKLPEYGSFFRQLGFRQQYSSSFCHGMVQAKVFSRP